MSESRERSFVLFFAMTLLAALPARSQSEQVEAGQLTVDGHAVAYRIRRLPLESFPELPSPVRSALEERQCMIPQTYGARRPENVIHGELRQKGSSDWAVLCSQKGTTSLLVFMGMAFGVPLELARQQDTALLQMRHSTGTLGFSWAIDLAHSARVREVGGSKSGPYDHDGIEDALVENSSQIHYYQQGHWLQFEGAAF